MRQAPHRHRGAPSALIAAKLRQANALHQRGQLDDARILYEEIVARQPKHFDALHLLGVVAAQTGNARRAVNYLSKAIKINPEMAAPHCNLGIALHELEQFDAALSSFDKAIALKPDYALAFFNRGHALTQMRRFAAALSSYDRALELNPRLSGVHSHRGYVLCELRRWDAALTSFDLAIGMEPRVAQLHFNRGNVQKELGLLEAALCSYGDAIALQPQYAEAHHNRGVILKQLLRLDEAVKSYDQSIAIKPDLAEAYFNRATTYLLAGDFERGWADYEWRWRAPSAPNFRERRDFEQPLWDGLAPLDGKTILLHGEQGLGDTLQFCRYAARVTGLGAHVILEVQPPLVRLLTRLQGVGQVIGKGSTLPDVDYQCPLLSLPRAFRTTLSNIPSAGPYLHADPDRVAHWRARLGRSGTPRIGLAWSGNPLHINDRHRSIPLGRLLRYLPEEFDYVALQTQIGDADRQALLEYPRVLNVADELTDFAETAALCHCVDLIVSVDTGVAHLGAGLNRKTWILLPFAPDWRWLLERDDSPWYPAVKLYRQPAVGDWESVLTRVQGDLRLWAA